MSLPIAFRRFSVWTLFLFASAMLLNSDAIAQEDPSDKTRSFALNIAATIVDLPQDANVRIWMPLPASNADQDIQLISHSFPAEVQTTQESVFGNRMFYCEAKPGEAGYLALSAEFSIARREIQGLQQTSDSTLTDAQRTHLLSANRLVPIDGKPQELLQDVELPATNMEKGRLLYEIVEQYMAYDKSKPGYGNGDVLWACDSRTGNCTDFHSMFISLARSLDIPAQFEIGVPLPDERGSGKIGGYHCWAKFHVAGKGWIPVDISEADKHPEMKEYYFGNLTENRVTFSQGRDLVLEPAQQGEPLNYFVFPYVEVDGEPWPKDKIRLQLRFHDLTATESD